MARTRELHRENPYRQIFTAEVVAVQDDVVELDATAFYARSGGQVGDRGLLGGHRVVDTGYGPDKSRVLHRVEWDGTPLLKGQYVQGHIDWERRLSTMRMHTAQHLLWLALNDAYGSGQQDRGGEIRPEKARLDVAWEGGRERPSAEALTERLNAYVEADLPVDRYRIIGSADRWEWRVPGHEPIPCGGTHVRRTSEVGPVTVGVTGKGRGVARLSVSPA